MSNNDPIMDDLRRLLHQETSSTQEELCLALQAQAHEVNQSKVSRLLRKLGAIKTHNEAGQIVYRLPQQEQAPPTTDVPLDRLVTTIAANDYAIVIHASPGSASLIARILDHHRSRLGILGTLAGDDTILVLPSHSQQLPQVLAAVQRLFH